MAISLASSPLAKPSAQHVFPKKSALHVSFQESRNTEHKNDQWSFDDCERTWYSASDYQQMKENAYSQAKQIWKKERRITDEDSFQNVVIRVYDRCCEAAKEANTCGLSDRDEAMLIKLIGRANTRTGLEKVFIREIAHDKRCRRAAMTKLVLQVQATHKAGSDKSRAALVHLSSQTITRASRLFAHHMALALEASLR